MYSCVMLCDDGGRWVCAQSSVVVDQRSTLPASSLFLVPLDSCRPLYIVFIFIVVARGPKYQEQLTFTLCLSNVRVGYFVLFVYSVSIFIVIARGPKYLRSN